MCKADQHGAIPRYVLHTSIMPYHFPFYPNRPSIPYKNIIVSHPIDLDYDESKEKLISICKYPRLSDRTK